MPDVNELSERERQILILVATGASNKEIAQQLVISANTVKVHLRNIFSKIEVTSRTEAAMFAVNNGLVQGPTSLSVDEIHPLTENGSGNPTTQYTETAPATSAVPSRPSARLRLWAFSLAVTLLLAAGGALVLASRQQPGQAAVTPPPQETPNITPRWQTLANMPTARYSLGLVSYEDRIFAIAGNVDGGGVTGLVERFDPANNTWAELARKPTPVGDVSAVALSGKIYVPGGKRAGGVVNDVLEIYDPGSDGWEAGASLPAPRSAYALLAFEGRLYLFGGWDGNEYRSEVWVYDPSRDAWETRTPMPTRRGFAGAAVSAGKIYVLGGYDGERALNTVEAYMPNQDAPGADPWESMPPMPQGAYGMGVASLADIIYLIGGAPETGSYSFAMTYFPAVQTWQRQDNVFSQPWSHMGLVPLGTQVYAVGGLFGEVPTSQALVYQAIYTISIPVVR